MAKANPFIPPGKDYGAVDTESRLRAIEEFNLEQCHAALEVLGLQATVEKKLRIRIRALAKLASTSTQDQSMADQKACTLCGADGHVAAQCSWNGEQAKAIFQHALAASPQLVAKEPEAKPVKLQHDIRGRAMWHDNCEKGNHFGSPMKPTAEGWVCVVCGDMAPYPTKEAKGE